MDPPSLFFVSYYLFSTNHSQFISLGKWPFDLSPPPRCPAAWRPPRPGHSGRSRPPRSSWTDPSDWSTQTAAGCEEAPPSAVWNNTDLFCHNSCAIGSVCARVGAFHEPWFKNNPRRFKFNLINVEAYLFWTNSEECFLVYRFFSQVPLSKRSPCWVETCCSTVLLFCVYLLSLA